MPECEKSGLAAQFEAALAELGPWGSRRIAVAVSGGPDSLALAMLAHDWCRAHGRAMLALTVDHGLRPEAAAEARGVAAVMAAHEIPCRILTLAGLNAGPGLAARARDARYAALFAACRNAGVIDLLLGHHARDQAETILMRNHRASGRSGRAAMAGVAVRDGIRLVRPLLATPYRALRAELHRRGIGWVEDPSNQNRSATRARFRAGLSDSAIETLAAAAQAAGRDRADAETATAAWLARYATIRPEGFVYLAALECPPEALSALIQSVGGHFYPPASASLARLAAALRPATLAGTRLVKAGNAPGYLLMREASAIARPVAAQANTLWDQRFRLIRRGQLPDHATIGALGDDAARLRNATRLPAALLRTLPAIRADGALLHVPFLPRGRVFPDTGSLLCFNPPKPASGALFRPIDQ